MFAGGMPQPQTTDGVSFPAPTGGVNAYDPLSSIGLTDSIFCFNLIHGQYGLRARRGYQAHVTGLDDPIRTFVPYLGADGTNLLFGLNVEGIWDVTSSTDTPIIDTAFGVTADPAGWASWTSFTTIAGQHTAMCDEANGYHIFDGSTWSVVAAGAGAGEIDNVDPADLVFVVAWKGMLLFVERDTAKMWFLPVGQLTGAASEFDFGTRFKHGGHLIGLYNWTIDGGEGVDDYLVALGSGGDVVVYKGSDPASAAAFGLHGQWYVGSFPAGRRVASSQGGDLLLITSNGVIPLSQLVAGANAADSQVYTTRKISTIVNTQLKQTLTTLGWEITLLPRDDLLMITTPLRDGYSSLQFVQNMTSQSWYFYRDFPCTTGIAWNGEFYHSDDEGSVFIHRGDFDNVSLDGTTFDFIEFSLLTSFQSFGAPTRYKRVQFLRPIFLTSGTPSFEVRAIYDYQLQEILPPATAPTISGDAWDVGLWDIALWSAGAEKYEAIRGGVGLGRKVAVALRGTASGELTLIEIEVLLDIGGHL